MVCSLVSVCLSSVCPSVRAFVCLCVVCKYARLGCLILGLVVRILPSAFPHLVRWNLLVNLRDAFSPSPGIYILTYLMFREVAARPSGALA